LLNKQIAARAKGVWLPFFPPDLRRSQIVYVNPRRTTLFQFKTETEILQEWYKLRAIIQLVGLEISSGKNVHFNFILSNGSRSTQRDEEYPTDQTHIFLADAPNKIRSVTIHYNIYQIAGFSF
jgi:hypothetical protein